jgi:hypothetical protein
MATLIKVDQCLNGRYVNSVYGDVMRHVCFDDFSFYKLEMNNAVVATFSDGATQCFQYSMCKVAADYTDGLTTVQHWCWNVVEKEL